MDAWIGTTISVWVLQMKLIWLFGTVRSVCSIKAHSTSLSIVSTIKSIISDTDVLDFLCFNFNRRTLFYFMDYRIP